MGTSFLNGGLTGTSMKAVDRKISHFRPGRAVKAVESQAGRELWGETRGSPSKMGATWKIYENMGNYKI